MIKSSSCDYSGAYIIAKGTTTFPNTGTASAPNDRNKRVIFKNCAPFTDRINEINNKELDHAKNIHVLMPVNNYSDNYNDNYLNTSGS